MKSLVIAAEKQTPEILIDLENGIIKMTGNSYPEDSAVFYLPILDFLNKSKDGLERVHCEIDFEFINSNSHKMIFEILLVLEQVYKMGKEVSVIWKYEEIDEDMMEMGEDMSSLIDIPMQVVGY